MRLLVLLPALLWPLVALAGGSYTPGMPQAGDYPNTWPLTGNERIGADTVLPEGVQPQSEAITTGQLAQYAGVGIPLSAVCDGITDNTAAIQSWLNKAAANVRLIAPAGTCLFSSPLTIGAVSNYDLGGAGQYATTFLYTGASTTATLLTANSPNAAGQTGITLHDFQIKSSTKMTDGYAIKVNSIFDSQISSVALDQVNGGLSTLCGGLWVNNTGLLSVSHPDFHSGNTSCNASSGHGDGIAVNSTTGGANLYVTGGGLIGGFAGAGLHMAGGFGGLTCDGRVGVIQNGVGLLVDEGISASPNRESKIYACPIDTNNGDGVVINDSGANGGTIILGDTVWSSQAGNGVHIISWPNGNVQIQGGSIYNNCGDGVYSQDNTTNVTFTPSVLINHNGYSTLSVACATWLAGVGNGRGYGIESASGNTKILAPMQVFDNVLSQFTTNITPPSIQQEPNYSVPDRAPSLKIGNATASFGAGIELYDQTTDKWGIRHNSLDHLVIIDQANSATNWLDVTTGGASTIGEGDTSELDVLGSLTVTDTGTNDSAAIYINETNNSSGGKAASIYFEDNSVQKWQITKNGVNVFSILDAANSFTSALSITTGGNTTIGETHTNILTNTGSLEVQNHLYGTTTTPALTSCGSGSPALSTGASDIHGTITEGTTATGCMLTFSGAYANKPDCIVTAPDGIAATSYSTAAGVAGSATLTIVNSAASGDRFTYICMGK